MALPPFGALLVNNVNKAKTIPKNMIPINKFIKTPFQTLLYALSLDKY
ncbi:hypothetical protein SE1039_19570 [Staphylococcus equorum]|nr:hypothetical protein SE1039_19570 [Staphylococcus equorum]